MFTNLHHLQVVHDALTRSECDRSTVGMVINRWDDMADDLQDHQLPHIKQVLEKLTRRLDLQTEPIHWAARALDPSNHTTSLDFPKPIMQSVNKFFDTYIHDEKDRTMASRQFTEFRRASGAFDSKDTALWALKHDPIAFWNLAENYAPQLAHLATRLWLCPANSVPSERAFSATNYVQNQYRTRLSTRTTSDLTYVYINYRALQRRTQLYQHQKERERLRMEQANSAWQSSKEKRLQELQLAHLSSLWNFEDDDDLYELEDCVVSGLQDENPAELPLDEVTLPLEDTIDFTEDFTPSFPMSDSYGLSQMSTQVPSQFSQFPASISPSTALMKQYDESQMSSFYIGIPDVDLDLSQPATKRQRL